MQKPLSQTEIQTLAAIIDVCCQRGAFRAKELVPVGNLYNRLTSMIVPENEKPTPFNQGGNINDDQGDGNKDK